MPQTINKVFDALADPNRRKMLIMLSKKEMSVNNIAGHFKFSRPAVSKHLRVLHQSKLVIPRREGRERYYRINADPLKEVYKWLEYFDKFWDKKLNLLKNFIENTK